MVLYMQEHFHSRPEELVTAIGPSICADCYEIGEDVAEQFRGHSGKSSAKGKDTRKISIGSVAGQSEHFIKCRGTSGTYCCNGCMYLP